MTTTVGQLIDIFYSQPAFPEPEFSTDPQPNLSRKGWTDHFEPITRRSVYQPTKESIDGFLGPGLDTEHRALSEIDDAGLRNPVHSLNSASESILSEGDVDRDFYQYFEPGFRFAFTGRPFFWPRSLAGPTGPTNTPVTVDYQLTWPMQNNIERAAIIGEMKQPFVIKELEWTTGQAPSTLTQRLQREMRGYAYHYRCPQVFVFDSVHLLVVQFRARDREDIKSPGCPVDCCVIPRHPKYQDQCTIQYALYRLAWRGWMRLSATLANGGSLPVSIGGINRVYEKWSGRPMWEVALGAYEFGQPNGYRRQFIRDQTGGFWVWVDNDRNILTYDTGNCLQ
ncbi:hypothetical protein QC761_0086040 [Podospora bellae-mahoneyi]|uniref:Uncharacterized protein n=1 Tax=Podospora bellae-mahoneyi TaxID=2093777 RepID=A0ABR0FF45_9PEZI|nr:hypothetical protein QC761_0086040 [Podospora bellae-mahoneyi]